MPPHHARWALHAAVAVLALTLAACAGAAASSSGTSDDAAAEPVTLRLGYLPNLTHAPAVVGVREGILADALGPGVALQTSTFNSGTEVVTGLFSGALDASYIGPGPAINAWHQSEGAAIRIIAGSTSGGVALVVRDGIESAEDLAGTTIATPALGNTQDVAARAWLAEEGLETTMEGGGDVQVLPQSNAQTLETFASGAIDGAWVPEPWGTRMVREAGGTVLLDEREHWEGGEFVTAHLVVAAEFLAEHPDVVADLLRGHVAAVDRITADPERAQEETNEGLLELVGQRLGPETIAGAWENLTFTVDPIPGSLAGAAEDAAEVGLLDPVDLAGIYDLSLLNDVLAELGRDAVDDGGLGA